jgi:hypothetical protein
MIKKFKQYIKEVSLDKYENIKIDHDECNNLVETNAIEITEDDIKKIDKHLKSKYDNMKISNGSNISYYLEGIPFKRKTINEYPASIRLDSTKKIKGKGEILHPAAAYIDIYKLTDDWFLLSFLRSDGIQFQDYKCDEMQGLLNQIDELIETYL